MKRITLIISFTALLFHMGCGHKSAHHEEEATFTVTSPIKQDTIVHNEYVAQIRSIQHIELRALEKGYLQKVYVDEGKLVKKGQLMFQIMPLLYQAEKQKAEAEANFAEIEYLNTKSLADSNIVSQNELALAKSKFDKAKAELALAQVHLGFTEVRAPFDGIMGRLEVRLGSLLGEGELLTTLSDNSKMWVYFNVPEAEYLNLVSQTNTDSIPHVHLQMANGRIFSQEGIVETMEADFNNETGNIAFRATFPNPKSMLRHGETGNILMPKVLKNVLIIPQKATFEILDKKYVFMVDEENVVQSRQIEVGQELPHLYVVTKGLKETDKILIEGLRKVKNKQKIHTKVVSPKQVLTELHALHAE
ncbi:efflux RND transporter periplasmic adaptor subunit [Cytophagales bacterium LB-30]|uniref:Efflux RND transporter periplasmic adaptor subunit n=1 Tax=Shiella aurantiaca TaxID=3058365 RepID=A0ABT8F0M4_9BACT|nr:efflux RND transporter periplasmic adaptor subunit [Shiella aurantiaca]MDN4163894.1 efflux RND transporter periplasmic adaptor subunit [Shiella aurantiaca]